MIFFEYLFIPDSNLYDIKSIIEIAKVNLLLLVFESNIGCYNCPLKSKSWMDWIYLLPASIVNWSIAGSGKSLIFDSYQTLSNAEVKN
jgi:hypothetical protein